MQSSTMVVDQELSNQGQSLLEFLLFLPFVIGIIVVMIRMNSAIQISIVNQQYARAYLLQLAYNSAYYPTISLQQDMTQRRLNQIVMGISSNTPNTVTDYSPAAPEQLVARNNQISAPNTPKEEPATRALVRVRNTATLCTFTVYLFDTNQPMRTLVPSNQSGNGYVAGYNITDNTNWGASFCGSVIPYEQ